MHFLCSDSIFRVLFTTFLEQTHDSLWLSLNMQLFLQKHKCLLKGNAIFNIAQVNDIIRQKKVADIQILCARATSVSREFQHLFIFVQFASLLVGLYLQLSSLWPFLSPSVHFCHPRVHRVWQVCLLLCNSAILRHCYNTPNARFHHLEPFSLTSPSV